MVRWLFSQLRFAGSVARRDPPRGGFFHALVRALSQAEPRSLVDMPPVSAARVVVRVRGGAVCQKASDAYIVLIRAPAIFSEMPLSH